MVRGIYGEARSKGVPRKERIGSQGVLRREGDVLGRGQALFGPTEVSVDVQMSSVKEIVDIEGDEGVLVGKPNQVRTAMKAGRERVSKTVTEAAKRETIVWLVNAKTRTKNDARKTVAISQSLVGRMDV